MRKRSFSKRVDDLMSKIRRIMACQEELLVAGWLTRRVFNWE